LLCVAVAGFGGSFYHPAATAMVVRLYPVGTGRALGIIGMGASVGFFLGPIYCGWRAETAGWRAPVLELGLLGIAGAIAFAFLAREETAREAASRNGHRLTTLFPSAALWCLFIGAALAFSMRDFAGSGMGSLSSLFLQRAHGMDLKSTGFALSATFIGALISNPLFGGLSDRGRFGWGCVLLFMAATIITIFPHLPRAVLIPTFAVYGFFFMATFPVVEAALMESVPDEVRGRVFGFFITIGGLIGNLSHWLVGRWVHRLGPAADSASSFHRAYAVLACMVLFAMVGLACLKAIRRREGLASHTASGVDAQPSSAQAS
jgi:MFS family permease